MEENTAKPKKSMMSPLLIAAAALLLLGGGWLVLSQNNNPTQQPSPTGVVNQEAEDESPSNAMEAEDEDEVDEEITIEGKNFSFDKEELKIDKGDKVRVTFKNTEGFHDWTLEYNGQKIATKQIQAGQSDSVEFTADTAGTFDYYCSVGNHRQMGMEGKLTVE